MKEFSPFTSIATVVIAVCLISVALFKLVPHVYVTPEQKRVVVRRPRSVVGRVLRVKETHKMVDATTGEQCTTTVTIIKL